MKLIVCINIKCKYPLNQSTRQISNDHKNDFKPHKNKNIFYKSNQEVRISYHNDLISMHYLLRFYILLFSYILALNSIQEKNIIV